MAFLPNLCVNQGKQKLPLWGRINGKMLLSPMVEPRHFGLRHYGLRPWKTISRMAEIAGIICGFRPAVLQKIGSYKSPLAPRCKINFPLFSLIPSSKGNSYTFTVLRSQTISRLFSLPSSKEKNIRLLIDMKNDLMSIWRKKRPVTCCYWLSA